MFGAKFCALFKRLQDETKPHRFKHTREILEEGLGKDWEDWLVLNERSVILGSGCIGQVYKGYINDKPVAVKILHPNVGHAIDADLDILRGMAKVADWMDERGKWLNFPGMVEEFSELLKVSKGN